jgi:hypothetical protein
MSLVNETVYLIQVYPRAAKMQTLKNGLPVRANIAIHFQTNQVKTSLYFWANVNSNGH